MKLTKLTSSYDEFNFEEEKIINKIVKCDRFNCFSFSHFGMLLRINTCEI